MSGDRRDRDVLHIKSARFVSAGNEFLFMRM